MTLVNGDNHDVLVGAYSFYKITGPTAMFSITGMSGGVDGKIVVLYNLTNQPMMIVNNSSLSAAGNRILTMSGDIVTPADSSSMMLQYSAAEGAWLVISKSNHSGVQIKGNYSGATQSLTIGATIPAINYTTLSNLSTSNYITVYNGASGPGQIKIDAYARIYSRPTALITTPTNEHHHFLVRLQRAEDAAFTTGVVTLCSARAGASFNTSGGAITYGYTTIPISYVDESISAGKTYYYRMQMMMNTINPIAGTVEITDRALNLMYVKDSF